MVNPCKFVSPTFATERNKKKQIIMETIKTKTTGRLQGERIVWLDTVRLTAMLTLVCCHCANPFNWVPADSPLAGDIKFWGGIYGAMLRHSVPLFVMITGALLLPIRSEAGPFYRKRIGRVFWPFAIWSIAYCLFPWLLGLMGLGKEVVQSFFPYAGDDFLSQSLTASLKNMAMLPFNFSTIGLHMWYIYMLIGIYLYMPIFSCWVEKASERAKLWFLVAWGIASLVPYYCRFVAPTMWGTCSWNAFGMLYYFAGYNGYLLLGHYLRHRTWSMKQILVRGIPMFVTGYCITYFGRNYMMGLHGCTEEMAELFWTNNSLNVILMTIPLFMACKAIRIKSGRIRMLLANLTLCGYGIYMIHYFFIGYAVILMRISGVPLGLQIPFAAVVALAVSWTIVAIGHKLLGSKAKWLFG